MRGLPVSIPHREAVDSPRSPDRTPRRRVSIPHREAVDSDASGSASSSSVSFQSLIGRLWTLLSFDCGLAATGFQSLIGRLWTNGWGLRNLQVYSFNPS